eukprot:CAMPEP_0202958504 /NCGR_PEP_ID=MMETSP1396-20130829/2837_1 /ASSEMBLY_ACC=CAM_ASM_000872 /TAXON_ID= /ORGANISM="Pseudokeronopsis sp., Strain Brazil" /LENGTH=65 /DNA_ID=CAMNT_0049676617 /DNA_START=134 /DNA_END=331 /DNA_ORIENTATION=+
MSDLLVRDANDFIEDVSSPDVALLDVVEAFVPAADDEVELLYVAHLVSLPEMSCQLQLRLLRTCK